MPARRWRIAAAMLTVVAVFYQLREHWGRALGPAPQALLLACPPMHSFHGRHRHLSQEPGRHDQRTETPAAADKKRTRP